MSFSAQVKNELSNMEVTEECCLRSELSALLRTNGHFKKQGEDKGYIYFITENPAIARRIFKLVKSLYHCQPEVSLRKSRRLKKNMKYTIYIGEIETVLAMVRDAALFEPGQHKMLPAKYLPLASLDKRCCKRAFLRGAFLGGGSMTDPEKNYHAEMLIKGLQKAKDLMKLLDYFELEPKMVRRKEYYMIYFKEGEKVVDFLNVIGAHKALLDLENIRVLKGIRNDVNRIVNCETANLNKIVDSSVKQIEAIEEIKREQGLDALPPILRELALLRLENPELGMAELGKLLQNPIGKSGVNHRFRKIMQIAEGFQNP